MSYSHIVYNKYWFKQSVKPWIKCSFKWFINTTMLYFYISLYYFTLQVKSKQMISGTLRQTTGHLWKISNRKSRGGLWEKKTFCFILTWPTIKKHDDKKSKHYKHQLILPPIGRQSNREASVEQGCTISRTYYRNCFTLI